ncbi:hypothetical protein RJ640_018860 [Escallonia rubra]|uniref:Uncharacterized protein n=1 Tax=Escallonia rubra TaxID=112253 RepID=A0AA88UNZ4_9ASTE|nr:hypothetical protein RJ640_018860 [Escallonia rubra]
MLIQDSLQEKLGLSLSIVSIQDIVHATDITGTVGHLTPEDGAQAPVMAALLPDGGASKGIGLEICRQLASKEILVILTARDEKKGLEATENLKVSGLSNVVFHQLDYIKNEKVRAELESIDSLTEDKIDDILQLFLRDFKEDRLKANGWPMTVSAYKVSKAVINAYTRLTAKNFPSILVNCVHPGYCVTDITLNMGHLTPEEGAQAPVMPASPSSEMEKPTSNPKEKRCAVVTGANKGIGLEICRQLASKGILVILTARDEKKGLEATKSLKVSGLSDLEVTDENLRLLTGIVEQTYEMAGECLETNYYGTKKVTEALLPLLQLSSSARIVNVSSIFGQLYVSESRTGKIDSLTEDKIDDILQLFLRDFREDRLKANGWPMTVSAYKVSKAVVNAYTRLTAKKFPSILVNCVHPGYCITDITCNMGHLTPEEGAQAPVMVALLPDGGGNKGVGLEICRQLASNDVMVILTARDEKRGTEAVDLLKASGLFDVVFHQLDDAKEDLLEEEGWLNLSAYIVSKAALNAYSRILAKKFTAFRVNAVSPGFCKTDLSHNNGQFTAEEGARGPVRMALIPADGPSGKFFYQMEESAF